jgi:tetrahydromethanopterin S-methyltransferase subunit G
MSDDRTGQPDNLVLVYLRRIDARLDGVERKLDEVVARLSSLEHGFAGFHIDLAAVNQRLDSLDLRVSRIERRLDLVDELG